MVISPRRFLDFASDRMAQQACDFQINKKNLYVNIKSSK